MNILVVAGPVALRHVLFFGEIQPVSVGLIALAGAELRHVELVEIVRRAVIHVGAHLAAISAPARRAAYDPGRQQRPPDRLGGHGTPSPGGSPVCLPAFFTSPS